MHNYSDSITIAVPAYNEEDNLRAIIEKIIKASSIWKESYIVIYDDASNDSTYEIAQSISDEFPNIKVIKNEKNLNLGGIFKKALRTCTTDYFIMIQGQNAISLSGIQNIFMAKGQADLIIPYQENKWERSIFRVIVSYLFTLSLNIIFLNRVRYFNHYVLTKTSYLKEITLQTNSYAYQAEIILKLLKKGKSYQNISVRDEFKHKAKTNAFRLKNIKGVLLFYITIFKEIYFK